MTVVWVSTVNNDTQLLSIPFDDAGKKTGLIIVVQDVKHTTTRKTIEDDKVGYVVILIRKGHNKSIVFCHLFQFYNAHYSIIYQTSCTPGYANKVPTRNMKSNDCLVQSRKGLRQLRSHGWPRTLRGLSRVVRYGTGLWDLDNRE